MDTPARPRGLDTALLRLAHDAAERRLRLATLGDRDLTQPASPARRRSAERVARLLAERARREPPAER
ncbi:MAG: hypothetical protein MUF21_03280 [Gemmatimonadaceae bacterium]|jgi:hypothetical protein|nr:hypothetical protein [Gemmatimonadaceae bacterium]